MKTVVNKDPMSPYTDYSLGQRCPSLSAVLGLRVRGGVELCGPVEPVSQPGELLDE